MVEQPFTLTISGPGLAFEQQVTADQAAGVISLILQARRGFGSAAAEAGASQASGPDEGERAALSAGEYLTDATAASNAERIAAFATFLREARGATDFSRDELRKCFAAAGEPEPRNFARDFNTAIAKHWISEASNVPGRFYATNLGMRAVRSGFGRKPSGGVEQHA